MGSPQALGDDARLAGVWSSRNSATRHLVKLEHSAAPRNARCAAYVDAPQRGCRVDRLEQVAPLVQINTLISPQRAGSAVSRVTLPAAIASSVEHIFTVDVEEYFQVAAFDRVVRRSEWGSYPSRIEHNMEVVLDLLAKHGATGTFFTLGWIAERYPHLVRRVHEAGHEVASHGFWHRRVDTLSQQEFREDVRASRAALENACGAAVVGFRAPNFSIKPGGEWAFDVLIEEGYRYDSSLFPIRRPGYGYPHSPTVPYVIHREGGELFELPLATLSWRGVRIPAAGGAYLRHFPYGVTRRAFREFGAHAIPATFYIHPWELDSEQPRLDVGMATRLRHYGGLARVIPRLERLLGEFRFTSAARSLKCQEPPVRPLTIRVSNAAD